MDRFSRIIQSTIDGTRLRFSSMGISLRRRRLMRKFGLRIVSQKDGSFCYVAPHGSHHNSQYQGCALDDPMYCPHCLRLRGVMSRLVMRDSSNHSRRDCDACGFFLYRLWVF